MSTIQIELARNDIGGIKQIKAIDKDITIAQPDHFEGGTEIISAVVSITSVTIPAIALLIQKHIELKRYIKVKIKGVEISGASLKDISSFLEKIQDKK